MLSVHDLLAAIGTDSGLRPRSNTPTTLTPVPVYVVIRSAGQSVRVTAAGATAVPYRAAVYGPGGLLVMPERKAGLFIQVDILPGDALYPLAEPTDAPAADPEATPPLGSDLPAASPETGQDRKVNDGSAWGHQQSEVARVKAAGLPNAGGET
ncbi:MAG: hypothetical protein K2X82_08425 [Gemmataceae bacterium]|nr:hypothetical protein [Gemmataceae bacterium]